MEDKCSSRRACWASCCCEGTDDCVCVCGVDLEALGSCLELKQESAVPISVWRGRMEVISGSKG